ncbi:GNAT family N-acetyltransferase [Nocardioides sp. IC4_145]|uniref:GNAT family N-acetyltransferase n=1 Tax=Nocardioides sp. IC4_145 TaxID=2714037 RepID=UPI001409052C|nr:GNAT family N-acetyltransferase [Nocardioides sp. IC4_145]NHC23179.1 GNAT family N-acetyltransferase [Nocardioides sp. IC4_145]
MSAPGGRLVEAGSLPAGELAAVRAIYEGAFPDELQAPFEDLLVDRLLVHVDADGPAGLALVRDLGPTSWTFLRYYAVGRRGRGTGSAMWADLAALLAEEGRTRLVWDVEDPDEPGLSPALVEEHRRRIVFYERLGGRLLPVRDYEPPHDDGHAPRLLLMDVPLGSGDEAPLRDVVEAVFRWRYGRTASDPVVRRTLEASGLA